MKTTHVTRKYLRPNVLEYRKYQDAMAKDALQANTLVVLPTGLGKTAVALHVILERMYHGPILFLAPTKVLAVQHCEFLKRMLEIDSIVVITGEDSRKKRRKSWNATVICTTPETARNDLESRNMDVEEFGLVVFDEAHRAVGDYAYVQIANFLTGTHFLALTATLPDTRGKEVMENLQIKNMVKRNDMDPDVVPYTHNTKVERHVVELPEIMREMQQLLKDELKERYNILRRGGMKFRGQSMSALVYYQKSILRKYRHVATPYYDAIRLHHALNMVEAHGAYSFLEFVGRMKNKGLCESEKFARVMYLANKCIEDKIEHPKMDMLENVIKDMGDRILIFAGYRDTVHVICRKLNAAGIKAEALVGRAGGLDRNKQAAVVDKLRKGTIRAMVATKIGEEGLDILDVNNVIFYDNVPSSIRLIQRMGRTGRKSDGKVTILITKNTIDETYDTISSKRAKIGK